MPTPLLSHTQVHKAVLLDGRVVAVKVQRPNVVPMLLGDIGNLKAFSLRLRSQLPVDYYTVSFPLMRASFTFLPLVIVPNLFFVCARKFSSGARVMRQDDC
jgi:hypothetical protein